MDRLAQLHAFVRLVERESFTEVAEELRVKQSTVSKWLAAMEVDLGTQLLDRTTRSQRVTDAGQQLYERAKTIVSLYEQTVAELREGDAVIRGRIRISLPTVFGRRYVVPLVTDLLRKHEALEVEMLLSDRYVSLVEEGYDLAVRVGVPIDSTLRSHTLGETTRKVVAAPSYLDANGIPSTPRELERHQCLVHAEPGRKTLWRFIQNGKTFRASVRGRACANHSEATLLMARRGLGICMLASWLVEDDIEAGRLVQLLEDYDPPNAPIRALTPPGSHLPRRIRLLLDYLRTGLQARLGL